MSTVVNKNKNIAIIISVILLFLAMIEGLPYGFFTLLRLVIFGTTVYLSWLAYKSEQRIWVWLFGFIALVFNPLLPFYLGRDLWVIIDLLVAFFLFVSIFTFKLPKNFKTK